MTREEIESRFADYLQQGEAFCTCATIRYEALFGDQALGINVLIMEYSRGLKELIKLYHKVGDHLDELRSFEAKAKLEHQEAMKQLQTHQEALDAARRDHEDKAAANQNLSDEFSKLTTKIGGLELAVLTTSSKVQTIHDDQVTREKLQADLESANRTTREQSAALAQLEHHLETANTKSTELEQENTTITQLLTGKESRIVELEHHLGTANTRSTEPEQQNTTITQLLSSKESRIMELETDLAEASAENRRLLMTVDGMERERDVLRQFWTI